jgi:hypothetical protein
MGINCTFRAHALHTYYSYILCIICYYLLSNVNELRDQVMQGFLFIRGYTIIIVRLLVGLLTLFEVSIASSAHKNIALSNMKCNLFKCN